MIHQWNTCPIHGHSAIPCRCAPSDPPGSNWVAALRLTAALLLSIALVSAISMWIPT